MSSKDLVLEEKSSVKTPKKINDAFGHKILTILDSMERPATEAEIVKILSQQLGVPKTSIRDAVSETLKCGVIHGYLKTQQRKFSLKSMDDMENMEGTDQVSKKKKRTKAPVAKSSEKKEPNKGIFSGWFC